MSLITGHRGATIAHRQESLSVQRSSTTTSNTAKVATLGTLILLAGTALYVGHKYLRAQSPKTPPAPRTSPVLPKDELKFPLPQKDIPDAAPDRCNAETPRTDGVTETPKTEGVTETPKTEGVTDTPRTEGVFEVVGKAETPRTDGVTETPITEGVFEIVGNTETPRAGGAAPAAAAAATEQPAHTEQQPKTPPSGGRRHHKKH